MRPILFVSALLLLSPAATLAQTTPRLYVGTSAVLMRFYPFESYASTRVGPAATVGVQLSPRWAVETGAQLTWRNESYTNDFTMPNGSLGNFYASQHLTNLVIPLLARLTVTSNDAPLHVDVLGGVSWLHGASSGSYVYSLPGSTTVSDYKGSSNYFCAGLGPQLRYSLGTHVDLKLNVPLNLRLSTDDVVEDFSRRFFFTPQLGVQYAFGS